MKIYLSIPTLILNFLLINLHIPSCLGLGIEIVDQTLLSGSGSNSQLRQIAEVEEIPGNKSIYIAGFSEGNTIQFNNEVISNLNNVSGVIIKFNPDNFSSSLFAVAGLPGKGVQYFSLEAVEFQGETFLAAGGMIIDGTVRNSIVDIYGFDGTLLNRNVVTSSSNTERVNDILQLQDENLLFLSGTFSSKGGLILFDWVNGLLIDSEYFDFTDSMYGIHDSGIVYGFGPSIGYVFGISLDANYQIVSSVSNSMSGKILSSIQDGDEILFGGSTETGSALILNSQLEVIDIPFNGGQYARVYGAYSSTAYNIYLGQSLSYSPHVVVDTKNHERAEFRVSSQGDYISGIINSKNQFIVVGRVQDAGRYKGVIHVYGVQGLNSPPELVVPDEVEICSSSSVPILISDEDGDNVDYVLSLDGVEVSSGTLLNAGSAMSFEDILTLSPGTYDAEILVTDNTDIVTKQFVLTVIGLPSVTLVAPDDINNTELPITLGLDLLDVTSLSVSYECLWVSPIGKVFDLTKNTEIEFTENEITIKKVPNISCELTINILASNDCAQEVVFQYNIAIERKSRFGNKLRCKLYFKHIKENIDVHKMRAKHFKNLALSIRNIVNSKYSGKHKNN